MRPKRTVLVIVEAFGGGVYSILKEQITCLSDKMNFIVVYSGRDQLPDDFQRYFDNYNVFFAQFDFSTSIFLPYRLVSLIDRMDYDYVHLHSAKAGFLGRLLYSYFFWKNKKVFYTPHCYAFLNRNFSYVERKLIWLTEYILGNFCTAIIACGKTEYGLSIKFGESRLVENGINKSIISIGENTNFLVVSCGRFCMQKNPDMFYVLAKENPDIKFIWVGDAPKSFCDLSNLEVTGWVSREESLQLISSADIYVQTSLWEGFAVAEIEAMSFGIPILAYDMPGTSDAVEEGLNGYVFNSQTQLNCRLRYLVDNELVRKNMGEKSYSLFCDSYTAKNYEKLLDIYAQF
jgi:glycosyltransferase involved in cell wall biosynthesis